MTVLDDIVAGVRQDLAVREARTPLAAVKERAARVPGAKECLGRLHDEEAVGVIAEVKRSSPSKGALATISDPAELASQYELGGARNTSKPYLSFAITTEPLHGRYVELKCTVNQRDEGGRGEGSLEN